METGSRVAASVDQLIALFHRRSEDLPDGVIAKQARFFLNGVSYEERLGRSPSDPLVKMLACGPAGYRFIAKALHHAVPDARIERGEITQRDGTARWQCWISGHMRGTGESTEALVDVEVTLNAAGAVERAAVAIDEASLERLRQARLR